MLRRKGINVLFIVVFTTLVVASAFTTVHWFFYLLVLLSWLIITLFGSFFIGLNYHLTALNNQPTTTKNWVSITFDDGPHPEITPKILTLLKNYNAKATFFCIGNRLQENQLLVKQMIDEGHTIGNHTYSHSNFFGFYNTQKVAKELLKTQEALQSITGLKPIIYRPAFGVTNPNIERAVQQTKLTTVGWNKRSLDTTPRSPKTILNRITKDLKKGDVILLHDTSDKTVIVLEQLLVFLQQNNLNSVTVDTLFKIKAYA